MLLIQSAACQLFMTPHRAGFNPIQERKDFSPYLQSLIFSGSADVLGISSFNLLILLLYCLIGITTFMIVFEICLGKSRWILFSCTNYDAFKGTAYLVQMQIFHSCCWWRKLKKVKNNAWHDKWNSCPVAPFDPTPYLHYVLSTSWAEVTPVQ